MYENTFFGIAIFFYYYGGKMKLKEKYDYLKRNYNEYLIILKSGSFYVTFDDDSYILNYLFKYKMKDNKVGFPSSNLNKILEILKNNQLNVIVDDLIITQKNNLYHEYLIKSNKNYIYEENFNNLIKEIKLITKNDNKKIDEIRSMLHEL